MGQNARRRTASAVFRRSIAIACPSHPSGDGRQIGGHLGPGIDVADDAGIGAVDPDVDHGRAVLDHVGRDHTGDADGRDEDVRVERVAGEILPSW